MRFLTTSVTGKAQEIMANVLMGIRSDFSIAGSTVEIGYMLKQVNQTKKVIWDKLSVPDRNFFANEHRILVAEFFDKLSRERIKASDVPIISGVLEEEVRYQPWQENEREEFFNRAKRLQATA